MAGKNIFTKRPGIIPQVALLAIGAVLVIALGLAIGYIIRSTTNTAKSNSHAVVVTNTANTNTSETNTSNPNVSANTNATISNTNSSHIIPQARKSTGIITWTGLQEIASLHIFAAANNNVNGSVYDYENGDSTNTFTSTKAHYYQVGTFASGTYKGDAIILVSSWGEGPYQFPDYRWFLKVGTKLQLLQNLIGDRTAGDLDIDLKAAGFNTSKVTLNKTIKISDLEYPATLTTPDQRYVLSRVSYIHIPFDTTNLQILYNDPTYGSAYTSILPVFSGSKDVLGVGPKIVNYSNGIFFKRPDGTTAIYSLMPDFIKKGPDNASYAQQYVPQITWSDGQANTTGYNWTDYSGCGSYNYLSVVPSNSVNPDTDLVKIGTSSKGDTIYGFKNPNHSYQKDYYKKTYSLGRSSNSNDSYSELKSYASFIATKPLIFFKDVYGRLVRLTNSNGLPAVECGKPVIYLYPQKTTNVSVQLSPVGGFTKSEPAYHQGWNVTAQLNGQLTDRATGLTYPYLFWEGRGGLYAEPNKGFIVAQADVHQFLTSTLAKLGLNTQESSDFITFWEPRMQNSPWYFISFYTNKVMDQLAPLKITPKPDSIIRILMDFKPLAQPINVPSYTITTPARKGFTVVEWGGVLR